MSHIFLALLVLLILLLILYLIRYGFSHLYDYRMGKDGIEIVLLGRFVVWSIGYRSIESISEVGMFSSIGGPLNYMFRGVVIGNRISIKGVVVVRKAGVFRFIVLTPENRALFVNSVTSHLMSSRNA
jgi:hypothetical protein